MAGIDHLGEFMHWLSTKTGKTLGRDLFANVAPDETTGVAIFVIEERGNAPQLLQSTSYIRKPRFRIDTRSTGPGPLQADYPDITAARNLSQTAYAACHALVGTKLHSTGASPSTGNWLFANPITEPYLAGRDDHNRVVFSFTVECERQGP